MKTKALCVYVLPLLLTGCMELRQHWFGAAPPEAPTTRSAFPVVPVTADQITPDNAHSQIRVLEEELRRELMVPSVLGCPCTGSTKTQREKK